MDAVVGRVTKQRMGTMVGRAVVVGRAAVVGRSAVVGRAAVVSVAAMVVSPPPPSSPSFPASAHGLACDLNERQSGPNVTLSLGVAGYAKVVVWDLVAVETRSNNGRLLEVTLC